MDNNWIFGDSVGLSFNSGVPTVLTQPVLSSHESCASLSDSNGNLLFYVGAPTNFVTTQYIIHKVWDKNHQVMPNGDSLMGNSSITQGSLIIPDIANPNFYYIFHIGIISGVGRYLYYSIVDITANSGNGDVISKNNQIFLLSNSSVSEKMVAVKHGNGRDWWVVFHDDANLYCMFILSPNGISNLTYQNIGTNLINGRGIGQMQFSSDGSKLITTGDNVVDLFDFDRCAGIISNWVYLGDTLFPALNRGYYGCSFSPNSQLMYVSNSDTLFQYNLNAANIRGSRLEIFNDTCQAFCHIGQHLLGPDNKIYIANAAGYTFGNTVYDTFNMSISFIENPNSLGTSCNFSYLGQYLGGKRSFFGLPNIPNYSLGPLTGSACDTLTSVHELNNTDAIDVFYADNKIHIKTKIGDQLTFRIYNANGQIIKSITFRSDTDLECLEVAGVYFYTILSNEGSRVSHGKLAIFPN